MRIELLLTLASASKSDKVTPTQTETQTKDSGWARTSRRRGLTKKGIEVALDKRFDVAQDLIDHCNRPTCRMRP